MPRRPVVIPRLTAKHYWQFRLAVIAGSGDAVLTPDEAAAFLTVSVSWLRRSSVPRAAEDVGGVKYLKSELIEYVRCRLSYSLVDKKRVS